MTVTIKQYMTKRNVMIGLGIFIFAGLMAWRIFGQAEATADKQASIAVTTVQTFEIDKQEALQLTGTVEGLTSSIISSRHSGRVESVNVENGQRVSAGQVLLSLDGLELNNAVRVAQNNVNQQEANL
ncbi:MAG: biotin/lipoyl-binding protein, partial [Veillonella sp.]|nr:biotin/lipoyl-binding protein [Veillonella sp.]